MEKEMTKLFTKRECMKKEYPYNLVLAVVNQIDVCTDMFPADILLSTQYALSALSPKEQNVIQQRYYERKTLVAIAESLDICYERVRQIEVRALRKLRDPAVFGFIQYGIAGFMQKKLHEQYHCAYNKGYIDGYMENIRKLTLEKLNLPTRAYNCLIRAGYKTIGNIMDLGSEEILRIRYLGMAGKITVANQLQQYGIKQTAWDIYSDKEIKKQPSSDGGCFL